MLEPVITQDEKNLAVVAHVLGLFTSVLGPLILFLVKKDSRFVRFHSLQAVYFQLLVLLAWIPSLVLSAVLIGCLLMLALTAAEIYLIVKAASGASRGEWSEYPLAGGWARNATS